MAQYGNTDTSVADGTMTAAVVCGFESSQPCPTIDVMKHHPMVEKVIPVYTCENLNVGLDDEEEDDGSGERLFECEKQITTLLKDETASGKKIQSVK